MKEKVTSKARVTVDEFETAKAHFYIKLQATVVMVGYSLSSLSTGTILVYIICQCHHGQWRSKAVD